MSPWRRDVSQSAPASIELVNLASSFKKEIVNININIVYYYNDCGYHFTSVVVVHVVATMTAETIVIFLVHFVALLTSLPVTLRKERL